LLISIDLVCTNFPVGFSFDFVLLRSSRFPELQTTHCRIRFKQLGPHCQPPRSGCAVRCRTLAATPPVLCVAPREVTGEGCSVWLRCRRRCLQLRRMFMSQPGIPVARARVQVMSQEARGHGSVPERMQAGERRPETDCDRLATGVGIGRAALDSASDVSAVCLSTFSRPGWLRKHACSRCPRPRFRLSACPIIFSASPPSPSCDSRIIFRLFEQLTHPAPSSPFCPSPSFLFLLSPSCHPTQMKQEQACDE
jgi:hypothetical protein